MFLIASCWSSFASESKPVPYKVKANLRDAIEVPPPAAVNMAGWLGARIDANATNRLLTIDVEPLLEGFRKKPGSHPWIGEHVGKWMHAATLAWAFTQDPRLRQKLDSTAAELTKTQEADGYLGTYVPGQRFGLHRGADWDVWSHKYNLIGLLTYHQYTGNEAALAACIKMGNLLIETFGPGKKSILAAGTHVGMAATSVLEPMVILYRLTGDERYLEFARYIVSSWNEENGPRIIGALMEHKQVNKTANAKAYEMLSNLVGLCELARATGKREWLNPVLIAWEDIVARRLYITGSASQAEHFREDHELPNDTGARVGETCVTTTWIQLNQQLLRLTGHTKFADELENTFYNHLAAAQHPRGDDWCYFTPLSGRKRYDSGITCCHSSGPRGMALAPLLSYLKGQRDGTDILLVNTFESSRAELSLGGSLTGIQQASRFPTTGRSVLTLRPATPARFAIGIRQPPWARELRLKINGKEEQPAGHEQGWVIMPAREWASGDRLEMLYELQPVVQSGSHGNTGLAALTYGPFVMAYDSAENPNLPAPRAIGFSDGPASVHADHGKSPRVLAKIRSARADLPFQANFVPFADAGASGGTFAIWLPAPATPLKENLSLLADGTESRSRSGNVPGSINDGDLESFVVTFDGRKAEEDWYAVTLDRPATISRVTFVAGNLFHDGGWFDASAGKPRVQVKSETDGQWKTVAGISTYPDTTATDGGLLKDPQKRKFEVRLDQPMQVVAVRVIGKPACGDNPQQAFSSCAELEAYK